MGINISDIIVALISGACLILQARLNKKQDQIEARRKDGQKRMGIILECTEASLYGIHELGANGRTTEAIKKLEAYKTEKSAT